MKEPFFKNRICYLIACLVCFVITGQYTMQAQPPTITSYTPASGAVGTLVTISGTNLSNPTGLSIGSVAAIQVSNDGSTLVAMVMPGAVTAGVSVTTVSGTAIGSGNFTVTPTPYPTLQQGSKLVGTGIIGTARHGWSSAISADGNTAIVSGYSDNSDEGAAWIYTRSSGGVWTQQGSKLVGTGAVGTAQQGRSVSISADGNTAIVGGIGDDSTIGAAWVFTRSGGVWTQQGSKLVGTGVSTFALQGYSVSLSADGNTAIVGGPADNGSIGAAWVFIRNGGVWTQQGSKLVGTGFSSFSGQGRSVSLSADGNTAIIGGDSDNSNIGAVWIFIRSGGVWTQQGSKLVGTGSAGSPRQGTSVSLSADGNTAIVGASTDNFNQGAAWVFVRSSGVWTQQGSKLIGNGATSIPALGISVSISADGNTAIVGGWADNSQEGGVWVYTRSAGVWTQQGTKLKGKGGSSNAHHGRSVSLSANGHTLIEGGHQDNSNIGAAWVFIPCPSETTYYVDQSISISGDGTSWATAFKTLDEALILAWNCSNVTTINVAQGTYIPDIKPFNPDGTNVVTANPRDATFHLRNGVAMYGGFPSGGGVRDIDANPTFLSGDFNGDDVITGTGSSLSITGNSENAFHVVVSISDNSTTRLDGFIITGGNANTSGSVLVETILLFQNGGGGMINYSSNTTIANCIFIGNNANSNGSGLLNRTASSPAISNCTFTLNVNTSHGGAGMANFIDCNPDISNCIFSFNNATLAGGMFNGNNSSPTVTNCTFNGNFASSSGGGMRNTLGGTPNISGCIFSNNSSISGGGMVNASSIAPIINNCTFSNNTANSGAGMYNSSGGSPTVTNSTFTGNTGALGGGLFNQNATTSPIITNCTFSGMIVTSYGGAIYNYNETTPVFTNCTIYGNHANVEGGGMANNDFAAPVITNCILWNNSSSGIAGIYNFNSTPVVSYSIIQGSVTYPGVGNLLMDPLFTNPSDPNGADNIHRTTDDGLRLQTGSPAINSSDPLTVTPVTDIIGTTRTGVFDMGAYEYDGCTPPVTSITNHTGTTIITCITTSISVTATGGIGYAWSGGATPTTANNSFTTAGTYTVTVTDSGGCTATASIAIIEDITPPITPVISGAASFCEGGNTTLSIPEQSGATYCWTDNNSTGTWETVGSAGFSAGLANYQSLAFSGSTPYVAFQDAANGDRTTLMKYNGTAWEIVGIAGFSAGVADYQSLAFSGSTPYVAFQDAANGDRTTVMKYNGTAWETVGSAGFSAGIANYQSLAIDGNTPYVAYQDAGNGNKTTVMNFNGTTWETVGSAGFSADAAIHQSLALSGTTPYVAYRDVGNGVKTTVMKFNGTAWETVGSAGFSAGVADFQSLAFNGSDPYVAYRDHGNGFKTTVMKFNGTAWETVGGAGFSAGLASYQSLAFNNGTPYVAYFDAGNSNKTTVMKFNGTDWETVGSAGFSEGLAVFQSLAFYGSTPYVAYQDEGNDYKTTVMQFVETCLSETNSLMVNEAGTYKVTVTLNNGCTASVSQTVTVTPITENTTTITTCGSYTWSVNSTVYTASGTYTSVTGCQTEILILTITPNTSNTTTITACDSYLWDVNGTTYNSSGTYTSVSGCHTEILNLTIVESTSNTTTITSCDNYLWDVNGQTYTVSGTYTFESGCVTEILELTIVESTSNTTTQSACGSYIWDVNGTTYNSSGTYTSVSGCHTEILNLTIVESTSNTTTITSCDNYLWDVNGQTYTVSGTYTFESGCVTEILELTIVESTSNTTTQSACGSYIWDVNGTTYNSSGTYTYITGCHTEILILTITPNTSNTTTITACDSYLWDVNGTAYNSSGTYTSVTGCHTEFLNLTILENTSNTTTTTDCDSYLWDVNGQTYTTSGTYTSVTGCHTEILNLTIIEGTSTTTTITACSSYLWDVNGETYNTTGTYTSVTGCHTEILILTITPNTSNTTTITACDSYLWDVNGQTYTTSGTYTSGSGCHTEILNLTIVESTSNTTIITSCDNYLWDVNGQTYTASGTYTSVTGCHTEVLNLTIVEGTSNTTTITSCDNYLWDVNGQTYTASGTYTSGSGCHTEILILTIVASTSNTTTITACDSYFWDVNGQTYTVSGSYTLESGCVTEILELTIVESTSNTTTQSACGSYIWDVNGTTYNSSGTYTSVTGCHTEILILTITPNTSNTTTITACDSYTWSVNSAVYTASGVYTSVSGCHTQILNLTITTSTTTTTTISTCGSYTWSVNSTVYTESGTFTSVSGCHTQLLNLTITGPCADCLGELGGPALPGTACDDGNPETQNDEYGTDCICAGTPINPLCNIGASLSGNSNVCAGGIIGLVATGGNLYLWSGPNGYASTSGSITRTNASILMSGVYSVTITNNDCTDILSTTVTVHPNPSATLTGATPVCSGGTITLTAPAGALSYAWSGPGGFATNTGSNNTLTRPNATTTMGGLYKVTVTNAGGCTASASRSVSVSAPTAASITGANSVCGNAVLSLNSPTVGVSHNWSGPGGFTFIGTPMTRTPAVAGTYTLTVTNAAGCISTASKTITITAAPNPTISNSSNCNKIQLMALGGNSYVWSGPNGFATVGSIVLRNPANAMMWGTYNVTVTGSGGCTATTSITVNPCSSKNLFTESSLTVYPNPAQNAATVNFTLSESENVNLSVFDMMGREISVLFNGIAETGVDYQLPIDLEVLPYGTYFAVLLRANGSREVVPVLVVK